MILLSLAIVFTQLSLLAFGGGNAILPEMQHQVVTVHHWMTAEQFSSLFAMAQAAPGPNMMIVPLVGWHVAGTAGLLVTSLAKFGPSSIITIYALKFWQRFKAHPLRARFEKALKPITVGLVLVSAWLIADASAQNLLLVIIVIVTAILGMFKKVHPLWVMALGAGLGMCLL
ncbi:MULTISPECIES: chromate transporter [unclassified Acinetobacter]|uniref:chromate transporter n=1 Tax=unclassified Acinetobacter TaxID=196816 RepID=UPI00244B9336|nr:MULTISPECIES: chromate transporter [unclassified Acinetobacter]MDH0030626.1 chromate transporter [Acinetobacter sp. GD04021]MDH0886263.1 chromate transporter [Acinetobacter sp. GD03873]MDH1081762.1 chromate transporter [Acinetobacter sp. GD03983]MDH2189740.1 chromate transporter [Acinetobacter sp. GD03645]MDH2202732.1 chromate transporter [Acinetobacter sp. GD03647]